MRRIEIFNKYGKQITMSDLKRENKEKKRNTVSRARLLSCGLITSQQLKSALDKGGLLPIKIGKVLYLDIAEVSKYITDMSLPKNEN